MGWGPWIQLDNQRVGKWIGTVGQGRLYGGGVDAGGTPLLDGTDLADAWAQESKGRQFRYFSEAVNVDAAAELAARANALSRTGTADTYNLDTVSSFERASVLPGTSPSRTAQYQDAALIVSGLAYVNEPDSFHWIEEYPGYMGQPMQYHPDDAPETGVGDFGEVIDQWVSVAWNVGEAELVSFYDNAPQIQVATIDPSTVAQPGVDTGYSFTVDAWPDTVSVTSTPVATEAVPPDVVAGYGFLGPYAVTDKGAALFDRGTDSTLPYLIETSALTDWAWDVDGTTTREAVFPLYARIITDFYYRPARFRLWSDTKPVPPHCRVWPREDRFGPSPRLWPAPKSIQTPGRAHGYM